MDITYIVFPALLIAIVLAAVWLERWSVPIILVACGAGILFGNDVLGVWDFGDVVLANELANLALVIILFHGGFSTKGSDFRSVALPAGGLATWGVLLTAAVTYACLHYVLGWATEKALLLAVIISSTDAAATFSILRRQSIPTRLSTTVQIESAANDPMAILITLVAVTTFTSGETVGAATVASFLWKFGIGPIVGYLCARLATWMFNSLQPEDRGYYYVLFLAVVLLTYGVAEAIQASGMLAVFAAGLTMGNSAFVHKQGVLYFSEAVSTVANISMFVMLGLLVKPSLWPDMWLEGTIVFLIITLIARPVAVFLGTIGMGIAVRNKLFASWAGLRGAVPIVLATYPAAAGMEIGEEVFNLVFFAVLLSILIQGSSLGPVAKLLALAAPSRPQPLFNLELITMAQTDYDLVVVDLPGPRGAEGPRIRDLKLPEGAVIVLITRGPEVVLPMGNTRLRGWDHITVLAHAPDEDAVCNALIQPFVERVTANGLVTETGPNLDDTLPSPPNGDARA